MKAFRQTDQQFTDQNRSESESDPRSYEATKTVAKKAQKQFLGSNGFKTNQSIKQSINQSINRLHLSVIGENLALLLNGDTITTDITDLKE